jgi:hypothetical protein
VFDVTSGKIMCTVEDSTQIYYDFQSAKGTVGLNITKSDMLYLEKLDFERRMAVEKDLERQWDLVRAPPKKLQSD